MVSDRIGFMQGRLSEGVDGKIQAFPWEHWRDEFQLAHEHGFSLMEWTLDHDRLQENPLMTAQGRMEITGLCEEYRIRIHSLTGDFLMQKPFFKTSGQYSEDLFGLFIKVIEACGAQGVEKIIFPLVDNGRMEGSAQQEILLTYLRKVIPTLKENHVQVCFELDMPVDDACSFIRRLPEEFFAINYDIGNSASLGYDYQFELKGYGARVANVHVKDRALHGSTVALGEGNADIRGVIQLFEKSGYKGNYILQTARCKDGRHVETLCRYRDMVQSYMGS